MTTSEYPHPPPPTKASLKSWWNHFVFAQRAKKEAEEKKGESRVPPQPFIGSSAYRQGGTYSLNMPNTATGQNVVFGKPLKESLRYASVQISTANSNGELYVWGFIPVVVAKWCVSPRPHSSTEVEGTFRVNGSNKRMRELQAAFEAPPRYGKNLDWKKEYYTSHDVASVFRRYLTQMPEPVIPNDMYHNVGTPTSPFSTQILIPPLVCLCAFVQFREALDRRPHSEDEVIATYKRLIRSLPRANQYLLLYVLDLLSVFARKSDKNLMTAKNLAVIFRPALLSHPSHELSPQEHQLSQDVLEFMIAHQDWFMLDIPPPPSATPKPGDAPVATTSGDGVDSSGDETNGGWKLLDTRKITEEKNHFGASGG
ncbi:hypothetical protein NLI96_g8099 [Meripilus lineatus]|uniref:Rho-GAP domain-containing protein n=1 Tax=Meripilus lineatus TaxID=2056292 RepID=A0AAD5UXY0_9APHY|nr:hypothetical protein NLI96_g8099 [Physisporinus lineatus]